MEPVITLRSPLGRQTGVTLMLTIFILLALTFAVMGLLYFVRYDNEVSANVAVRTSAQQASDIGLEAANNALQQLPAFPQTLPTVGGTWYDPALTSATGVPATPAASFWTACAGTTCTQQTVTVGALTFVVEYVVEPTNLPAQTLNGYEIQSNGSATYLTYDAFVDVTLSQPGFNPLEASNMHVDAEAVLRKEG
ncbi:MAG: hypothetical protein M0Z76_07140 [Gammaproteobacteria bacterium]|nr:hypothetical protein [Gammaproteobacteria bacterium]